LDTGTTTLELAALLKDGERLPVITPSLAVASELQHAAGVEVILLGGVIRRGSPDLTGPVTEHCLELFAADLAFQGADAIGLDGAIFNSDLRLARVDQLMRKIAKQSCVLCDASKIGHTALARSGTLADVDYFITDKAAPAAALKRFAQLGPKIVTVSPETRPPMSTSTTEAFSTLEWGRVDLARVPHLPVPPPGPQSQHWHERCTKHFKGLSAQVKLFPVTFASGEGCVLRDVDGNEYIDFSSGIYVTTLGHCHPKISEGIAKAASQLMNAHDFTTPIKTELMEKLASVLPGDLNGFQLYDCGTAAVEAGIRVLRAATGKHETISCFYDFHGKTYGAVSHGHIRSHVYGAVRAPGAHMVPRPDKYRPIWTKADGTIDTDQYIAFYEQYIDRATIGSVAGFVLEPIQGWGGSIMPPDDFFPKLRKFCDAKKILLMADEVLTSWGRTGKFLCLEHWGVVPDVVTMGKGFGNGFPVTCVAVREQFKESFESISASSSYGGNPMACAAALISTQVIEEENLLERATHLGELAMKRMEKMKAAHRIIGDVRAKGCLMGIELVKDRTTKEPFDKAGTLVYQKAFRKGLAWIPAGHILRMSPPIVMDDATLLKGLDIIDEAIGETARELGYS
ncbi:MAG TPA: aminotransferase class III-fold pyridoxal phosphate-dependent enzyme, partial [Opitutaceae bacterium]